MQKPLAAALALSIGSISLVACGAPKSTDFLTTEGDSTGKGGGGSSQGGSATGGGGGSPGGSPAIGGSATGGSATGGSATGGSATGGAAGMSTGGTSTGGTSGSSGSASGGTDMGGSGGSGVSGSAGSGGAMSECDATVLQAEAALRAARACNPNTGGMLCTGNVQDLCGCTVPVDKPGSEETKAYLALRDAALGCGVACPAIPCSEPTNRTVCFLGDSTSCMYVR